MEMVQLPEGIPSFMHINQNEFSGRRHIKLKEEDIAICECKYDANDSDSSCGERCLNFLTSTECTPGYCPCSEYCKNQKFQKCEYAKMKLFKTEGRGWGLLADENIKAGHFIIEYCGEVISSEEAKQRSQTYEKQGLKDAYIISLNANYFIDATTKGSLARFINHSCQPNCETRKWTVLGETRVGIFAKQDIYIGTELAYDYNFEWYGGATVRCLCGAANCSLFLGAKSQGFQAYNHVWEDGDDRYTIDKIPLYDSAEDEPSSKLTKATSLLRPESSFGRNISYTGITDSSLGFEHQFGPSAFSDERLYSLPVEVVGVSAVKSENNEDVKPLSENTQQPFPQMNVMMSHSQSNSAFPNYNTEPTRISKKKAKHIPNKGVKHTSGKQVNEERVAQLFASKEAQEEITKYKEIKNRATSELNLLYDEIRPAIEEHERDSQDSVPTSVAEKWIGATCAKLRADFNFHFSIVKNVVCPSAPSQQATDEAKPAGDSGNELKYLTN